MYISSALEGKVSLSLSAEGRGCWGGGGRKGNHWAAAAGPRTGLWTLGSGHCFCEHLSCLFVCFLSKKIYYEIGIILVCFSFKAKIFLNFSVS